MQCIENVEDAQQQYFPEVKLDELQISISNFYLLLPRLLRNLQNSNCRHGNIKGKFMLMCYKIF